MEKMTLNKLIDKVEDIYFLTELKDIKHVNLTNEQSEKLNNLKTGFNILLGYFNNKGKALKEIIHEFSSRDDFDPVVLQNFLSEVAE